MRAVNPQTGEVFELVDGQWQKVTEAAPAKQAGPAEPAPKLIDNALQGALIGAGDFFNTVGINARDAWAGLRGDRKGQIQAALDRQDAARIREQMRAEAPISTAIGGALPALATLPIGAGVGGAGVLAGTAGRIGTQLGLGALTGAAGSESGNMGEDAGLGAALSGAGMLAGNMVSRVQAARGARAQAMAADEVGRELGIAGMAGQAGGRMSEGYAANLAAGQRVGMQTTLGMQTGNRALQNFEAAAKVNPMWGQPFIAVEEANRRTAVQTALRALGQQGDSITPDVMARAAQRFSEWGDSIAAKVGTVEVGPLRDKLQKLATAHAKEGLPDPKVPALMARFESGAEARMLDDLGNKATSDAMSGRQLMSMRSDVLDEMQSAYRNGRPGLGRTLAGMVDAIDQEMAGAVARQAAKDGGKAGAAFLDDFRRFRDSYKVFAALADGGANQVGELMPGRIAAALRRNDKTGYVGGGIRAGEAPGANPVGDFYDAIRFLNGVGQDTLPMNGSRVVGGNLMQGEGIKARAAATFLGSPLARLYLRSDPRTAQAWLTTLEAVRTAEASQGATLAGAAAGRGLGGLLGGL